MIVYGSGNADGNRHTHDNLPVVLAGGGGGTLTPGRYVKHGSKPLTNLYLSMADRLGLARPRALRRFRRPARQRLSRARWPPLPSPPIGSGDDLDNPLQGRRGSPLGVLGMSNPAASGTIPEVT